MTWILRYLYLVQVRTQHNPANVSSKFESSSEFTSRSWRNVDIFFILFVTSIKWQLQKQLCRQGDLLNGDFSTSPLRDCVLQQHMRICHLEKKPPSYPSRVYGGFIFQECVFGPSVFLSKAFSARCGTTQCRFIRPRIFWSAWSGLGAAFPSAIVGGYKV